jgi:hypothetical protein
VGGGRGGGGRRGGEMTQALYAHMNNKRKKKAQTVLKTKKNKKIHCLFKVKNVSKQRIFISSH